MLVRTIHPLSQLLPIWDAVIAENEDLAMLPQGTSSKMELLVDVCTAMLLLVKDSLKTINEAHRDNVRDPRRGFWMDADNDRLLFDENVPDLPADGNEEKTILAREMLRAYPIEAVEVNEVLRVMWEIRQRRIMALLDGEDLEAIVLPAAKLTERPDTEGFASKLGSLAIKAGSSVKETINPLPRYTTAAPIVNISSMKNSLVSGGERLKDYADTLQKSDTAAQVSKVSSNLTAVALMKLNDLAVASAKEAEGKSAWSIGAATKLWTRNRNMESDVIASPSRDKVQVADSASSSLPTIENGVSSEIESDTSIQNAPTSLFRRDTNLPPSFITPRGSIIYPAGRYRPKASNVGQGKPSLQSRLAAVASTPANMSTTTVSPERSAVRPLILSKSAKPASPLYGLPDPGKSSATSTNISPSPSLQNLDIENYVPRRVSISRRSQRSSLGGGSERDDSAGVDSVHSTSARLRKATRDSYGTASDNRRYRLSDPGAADDAKAKQSAAATSSQADAERYQLRDEVSPPSDNDTSAAGSRRESLDDAALAAGAGGVTRSKVVRKGKFASKPAHFRLQSAGHIDLDSDGVKPTSPAISDREVQTTLSNGDLNGHSIRPADTVPLTSETSQATTPKSLILPERPERSSSLLNRQHNPLVVRPTVDVQHLDVVRDAEEDEPLSAKDGYGDLLESYAAALESL
ncbi:hypothetical protein QFC19_003611 [Naganishia cerealis]|uniref:Uncharacterized protein n=1 Tax=Naganishia cerealis TaxID=610337 RepID=A0ACC2W1A0_9TREE|nr:hypothetical protein QFC19_003611 [Naganishia cerealis]